MTGKPGVALGFDHGEKRIGVAVGQRITGTASSLVTLSARDGQPDWPDVAELVRTWQPDVLVVGLPRHADGTESDSGRAAARFARRLEGRYGLRVETIDERLSSRAAETLLSDGGGLVKDAGSIDREAARIILQDWLDLNTTKY